jgi:protease-4
MPRVLLVLLSLLPAAASAQLSRETSPVDLPGYGLAAPDGPESVVLNPAAMAFLESWGVGYAHADSGDAERMLRGDGFYAATPVLFGIAAGAAVDSVRPTPLALQGERTMISLALGWQYEDAIAIGGAVRFLVSDDARLAGVTTLDLAASWRPVDYFALSLLARDLVGPGLHGTDESVARSFVLATALRPFGDRWLTLDLAGAIDDEARIGARAALEIGVPYVGRAIGALEMDGLEDGDPELRAVAGLAIDWGQIGAGGGVHVGEGFEGAPGWYVSARVDGATREGLPQGSYVVEIPLEGIGPRGIVWAVRRLDRALHDDRVAGVLLRPRGSGIGLAYAQEIRLMIEELQAAGKRVVCHLDDAAGSEWYACAGADRILLDPAGGVRLVGPSTELLLLGDLLRNAGVRADFVRIGEHKSAIEEYMNDAQSGPARRQTDAVLDWAYRRMIHDASADLEVSRERMIELVDEGPHLPSSAERTGLVDALADARDMDEELREGFGGGFPRERGEPWEMPARWGNRPRVGVVVIDGTIADGENVDIPLIGIHLSGGRTVVRAIETMAADPSVVAIVLRIDSPGGSVLASDQIYRAVLRARERKPVIASLGAVAASGGYYVAAPAHEIWADPTTITGSIGIWFGKVDFVPLAEMIGATLEERGRGRHAGATSLYRPFTAEERAVLADSVRDWYRAFLRRVARGRGMSVREVDRLGRGRLWMGDEAIENGLVDHLGGLGSAIAAARRAAGVGPEVDIEVLPTRPVTLLDYVLGFLGIGAMPVDPVAAEAQAALLERIAPELRAALGTLVTVRHLGSGSAMAMMPEIAVPR